MAGQARLRILSLLLLLACLVASFAACGGKNGAASSASFSSSTSSGGHGGNAAVSSTASGTTTHATSSGGGSGGGISLGDSGPPSMTFTVSPANASATITTTTTPATVTFSALADGAPASSGVSWTLDSYAAGSISPSGVFTTTGLVGGSYTVTAHYGSQTATAQLTVKVDLSQTVIQGSGDPGPSSGDTTALMGSPMPDPTPDGGSPGAGGGTAATGPSQFLYPYDQTVMPRGLVSPVLQWSEGVIPPTDARVTLSSTYFTWQGFFHVQNPAQPQFQVPQNIWDAALLSTGGQTLTITVVWASNSLAYGPITTHITVAPASLAGAVYYMSYDTPGLYSVLPGSPQPAQLIINGCLVCHSVSANGTRLAVGTDDATYEAQSGVYAIGADGGASILAGPPSGLGGDSRDLSFATFTPDGQYVMRSQSNFWGGVNQLAWKLGVNDAGVEALLPATVVGLGPDVSAFVPKISPDGKHYAFTNGDGVTAPDGGVAFGTPYKSISLMDLDVDSTTDTLTFSNRQLILDNGPAGAVAKFVTFLPDPNLIVLEEGSNFCASYGYMLPTWDVTCGSYSYTGSTGSLFMINAASGAQIPLTNLNTGNAAIDNDRNYEPFALPIAAGGYFWVVFTSIREYGNTLTGSNIKKQVWVAAISTNPEAGVDPSHPPFYLPNQSPTRNERAAWALQPCFPDGQSCTTGDQCCDGFCRPSDPNNPQSPTVCSMPVVGQCSNVAEKCTQNSDCCGSASGITCIGGFCTQPSPT